ncbi:MAG: hypothetical protein HQL19_06250 [Candidatus Omnitrophica bacterium]|nr:hypothetical protein [Candidatus Omnitrophota bacterium]
MKKDIRIRAAKFLVTQGIILVGVMAVFLVLFSFFFVRNAKMWTLRNIEDDLLVFSQQAAKSGEVPRRGDVGEYTFFIISPDGKYILPRFPKTDENQRLWQEYEAKLLYEMQKRKDGWIYYPEQAGLKWGEGQYVIRFVAVDKFGWIVAAEGFLPSPSRLLAGLLTPGLFFGILVILAGAIALMIMNANWHFNRVIRAILRSQENIFIATEAHKPLADAPFVRMEERKTVSANIVRPPAEQVLPHKGREDHVDRPEVSVPAPQAVPLKKSKEPDEVFDPRQLDDLGKVTIETSDIRSPLLRQVIEEMREAKK